jgi:hypothetical protein
MTGDNLIEVVVELQNAANAVSFRDIAVPMIARGIPVIPLRTRSKQAFLKNWQDLATIDAEQIEGWHKKDPHYNCGAVAKLDGFWFLDCDDPNLPNLIETETGQKVPSTLTVQSSKGLHFYFRHNEFSKSLGQNIQLNDGQGKVLADVKINNGYVVSPGSIHPTSVL